MKINNVSDLCGFINERMGVCNTDNCEYCPLQSDGDIKLEGELKIACEHKWKYDIKGKHGYHGNTIILECKKPNCEFEEEKYIQQMNPNKLNALFEED